MDSKPKYFSRLIGKAVIIDDANDNLDKKLKAAKAEASLEERGKFPIGLVSQPDVLALQSVIITTGRPGNLNDDVMLNEEILPVLWTAALKPFNMEHTKFIVGTMFDAFAVDKDTGEVVASIDKFREEESDEDRDQELSELDSVIASLPENLDIITNQVLWSLHFPEEVRDVKRQAIAGELFVSMELWFARYDYLVGNKIVKRTPETSELLDPRLRIRGGSGLLGLERVRRIPRDIIFAGNAAVETPANPESFILDVMDRNDLIDERELVTEDEIHASIINNDAHVQQVVADNTMRTFKSLSSDSDISKNESDACEAGRSGDIKGGDAISSELVCAEVVEVVTQELKMKETNELKIVELLEKNAVLASRADDSDAALTEANKDNGELQAKVTELEAKLEETLSRVSESEAALVAKAEAFEELETAKAELDTKLEETSVALAEIEEARKLDARKGALSELGLSDERVVRLLAKTADLDDGAFDMELEDIKAFMSELTPEVTEVESVIVDTEEVVEDSEDATDDTVETVEASEEEIVEVLEEVIEEDSAVAEVVGSVASDETEDNADLKSALAKALGIRLDA